MKRGDKLTAAAGVAACAACCAPLVLGPLAALGGLVTAAAGAAGITSTATHHAPTWLLVVLAVLTLSVALGVAYTIAVLTSRRSRRGSQASQLTTTLALLPVTDLTRPNR